MKEVCVLTVDIKWISEVVIRQLPNSDSGICTTTEANVPADAHCHTQDRPSAGKQMVNSGEVSKTAVLPMPSDGMDRLDIH